MERHTEDDVDLSRDNGNAAAEDASLTTRRALVAGAITTTVAGCLGGGEPTPSPTGDGTSPSATADGAGPSPSAGGPTESTPTDLPDAIGEVQLEATFAEDPTGDWSGKGWEWRPDGGASSDGSVAIADGKLLSPSVSLAAQAYYEVEFDAASDADGLVSMYHTLTRNDNNELTVGSDAYTSVLSDRPLGTPQSYMVRGRVGQDETVLQFSTNNAPIEIDTTSSTRVRPTAVAEWSDAVIDRAAPVTYDPPDGRFEPLPETRSTIADGGSLTVVIVGDSIMNDVANGHPDVLLERANPGLEVELVAAVRGSTPVGWFASSDRAQEHVLAHDPDLIVAGGVSTNEASEYRSLIETVSGGSSAEFLAMTGGISPPDWQYTSDDPDFRSAAESIATEEGVGFFDSREAFEGDLDRTGIERTTLQRDFVHGNSRGKAVLARQLTRFLTPAD